MKISAALLGRYIDDLPDDERILRHLLDDVGVEVKRVTEGVFTTEFLANRGDHHCYHGVAREVSGRTGAKVTMPSCTALEVGSSPVRLSNQTDKCLLYTATLLERVTSDGSLSERSLATLTAADIHSLTAPVDATNLSNLEIGQPTHAFDADAIVGGITIRESIDGESCLPLFAEQRVTLPAGTCVIADDVKILAVAGVIGCEESKTTETTTRLLLESATFEPVSVRKASRAMGIHTDSSARFERGSDPSLALVGAGRVVELLETEAGWQRVGATGLVGDWTNPNRQIRLSVAAANDFLETQLSPDEVTTRLARYGFSIQGLGGLLHVVVPPHRLWDVFNVQDLYEELAKSVGYNATPTTLPQVDQGALPSQAEARRDLADDVLCGFGFYEVITDGFYSRETRDLLGIHENHPLWGHIETLNSLDKGYSLLKNNTLAQAVQTVGKALRMRHDQVKAYEWTTTFHPGKGQWFDVCRERPVFWAIASGLDRPPTWAGGHRAADSFTMMAMVRELSVALNVPLSFTEVGQHPLTDALHPNRRRFITSASGAVVGICGEVHPDVLSRGKIKRARPVYVEIDAQALLQSDAKRPSFSDPPDWHAVVRNLAFTLPHGVQAGAIAELLVSAGPEHLGSVDIVDEYRHEEDGKAVRTITFALSFDNPSFDVTADQVNEICTGLIADVDSAWGSRGVKLR
jgi:phenylalanyl-tRNA synthetase beta chain